MKLKSSKRRWKKPAQLLSLNKIVYGLKAFNDAVVWSNKHERGVGGISAADALVRCLVLTAEGLHTARESVRGAD